MKLIFNYAYRKSTDQANVVNSMKVLSHLITGNDEQMKVRTTNKQEDFNEYLKIVLSTPEFLPQVLELVGHSNKNVTTQVYLIAYNIVQRSDENVVFVIENEKFMKTLNKAISNEEKDVRIIFFFF